jgi:hypothetical protein
MKSLIRLLALVVSGFSAVAFADAPVLLQQTLWSGCSLQEREAENRALTWSKKIEFSTNGTYEFIQQFGTFSNCPAIPIQPNGPSIESTMVQRGTYRIGDAVPGAAGALELDLSIRQLQLRIGAAMTDERRALFEERFGVSLDQPNTMIDLISTQVVDTYLAMRISRTIQGTVLQLTSGNIATGLGFTQSTRSVDFGTAIDLSPARTQFEILTIQN